MTSSTKSLFETTQKQLDTVILQDFVKHLPFLSGPRKSSLNVIKISSNKSVSEALKALSSHGILSCPIFDPASEEYVGILDIQDIFRGLLKHVHGPFHELEEEDFLRHHHRLGMAEMQSLGIEFGKTRIADLFHDGELWFKGNSRSTLMALIKNGFRILNPAPQPSGTSHSTRIHHRVALFDILPGQVTPDGPIPEWHISHIISQMDVLKFFVTNHPLLSDPGWKKPVLDVLGLVGNHLNPVETVRADVPAFTALALMERRGLSGLGVVDEEGSLCGSISMSDVRGLVPERFGALVLPVGAFLLLQSPECSLSWEEALLEKYPRGGDWKRALLCNPALCCEARTQTLNDAMRLLVENRKHRVYVMEGRDIVGVVTPTDVLRAVVTL